MTQSKEYRNLKTKVRQGIQQDLMTVTEILETLDQIYDLGQTDYLDAVTKALDEPVPVSKLNKPENTYRVRRAD